MVYVLYLNTTFYDFETHYDDYVLGVFSSEEKAKEAYEKFLEEHLNEDGRLAWPRAHDWDFDITTYDLDRLGKGTVLVRLKSSECEEEE